MNETRPSTRLQIGSLIFPEIDQIDFTGPFEVFSRIPNATCLTIAKERGPLRDGRGLILTPEKTFAEVGQLDLLHVPGGPGQEALMDDEETLSFIRRQSENAKYIFSVCTGALILGAAGLLRGKKATTHWAAFQRGVCQVGSRSSFPDAKPGASEQSHVVTLLVDQRSRHCGSFRAGWASP